jgi:DSF synthase
MNKIEPLHRDLPTSTIRVEHDASNGTHWCFMHAQQAFADPEYRACFSPRLLRELRLFAQQTIDGINEACAAADNHIAHIVLGSDTHVFNLGGDLALFSNLIRARDRDGLMRYARECVDSIHLLHTRLHPNAHTIGLVEGDALGGGFELALACQTIVAEEGVQMGFPEVLFGLFPGMGAYSFLCKRVSPQLAEKIILDGTIYSSEEMYRMGVIDVLVPKGQGEAAVQEIIDKQQSRPHAHLALNAVRAIAQPVGYNELMGITEVWVDTALALGEKSLKTMERIVKAQTRLAARSAA